MDAWDRINETIGVAIWPVVVVVAILVFRQDIHDILRRLRKGKVSGVELELDSDEVSPRVAEAVAEVENDIASLTNNLPVATIGNFAKLIAEVVRSSAEAGQEAARCRQQRGRSDWARERLRLPHRQM